MIIPERARFSASYALGPSFAGYSLAVRLSSVLVVVGAVLTLMGQAKADAILDWNAEALQAIRTAKSAPPMAARNLAIVSGAAFDAVNSISNSGYRNVFYTGAGNAGASKEAAAIQAQYDTLRALYPAQAGQFKTLYDNQMSQIAPGAARDAGMALGAKTAAAALAARTNDGSATAGSVPDGRSNDLGKWRPTPSNFASGALPGWSQVRPFTLNSSDQFRADEMPALGTAEYAAAYNEVKALGGLTSLARTADQTEIAMFWIGGSGTATPPGHWNRIAAGVSQDRNLSMEDNARMFLLLNFSLADAAVSAWDTKYTFQCWRPITAIHQGDLDGNVTTDGDANWSPLIPTPNHPSYVSGHSTFSGAAATALADFFGTDAISFEAESEDITATRHFNSFSQAAAEAGKSRIYGGIHFEFDNAAGLAMGQNVAHWALQSLNSPVPEPVTLLAMGAGLAALVRRRRRAASE